MAKVNVVIVDATGNKEQKVGLPDDVKCGIIMVKLIEKIKLPSVGPDGNPISYKFIHKVTGRQLLEAQTLAEAGIKDGDVLRLQPEITAGAKKTYKIKGISILVLLVSVLATLIGCGSVNYKNGMNAYNSGDYAMAVSEFVKASGNDEATAAIHDIMYEMISGDFTDAISDATTHLKDFVTEETSKFYSWYYAGQRGEYSFDYESEKCKQMNEDRTAIEAAFNKIRTIFTTEILKQCDKKTNAAYEKLQETYLYATSLFTPGNAYQCVFQFQNVGSTSTSSYTPEQFANILKELDSALNNLK